MQKLGPAIAFAVNDWNTVFQLGVELQWLAHLTATDGMTVIRPDLTLLGFGVIFQMEGPPTGLPIRIVDPYAPAETEPASGTLSMLGGARHQSAAVTCHHFRGAVAIVASEDGNLSAMRWDSITKPCSSIDTLNSCSICKGRVARVMLSMRASLLARAGRL